MENQPTQLDKAVKISIIVGALIVALSIAYYLVIFLPQKERGRVEQQKQEQLTKDQKESSAMIESAQKESELKRVKCAEDAKKFNEEYIKSVKGYYFEPQYTYSATLGSCLYSGGYSDQRMNDLSIEDSIKLGCMDNYDMNKCGYWERFVKDIYTNKDVITTWRGAGKEGLDDFWKKHNDLFSK